MLSRLSDVLQSAADVLAPPASRLEDFEYHWKMVVNFYQNYEESSKLHIEDTRLPHHLNLMLQLIVEEQAERAEGAEHPGEPGPCLEAVVRRRVPLLDALAAQARADRPAGARAAALCLAAALLRRTRRPRLHAAHVHRPLQRMLVECSSAGASPTEREEAELLLALCGAVRRDPALADLFTAPCGAADPASPDDVLQLIPARGRKRAPRGNPLLDVEPPRARVALVRRDGDGDSGGEGGDHDEFLLIQLLLRYLASADNQVVLRACEGIMIVSSLPADDIANLVASSPCCERVVELLLHKFRAVPPHLDPADVDALNITWAYVSPQFCDASAGHFPGRRQLTAFLSWLDYCDTLMKECHPTIAAHLSRVFRSHFLEAAAEELGSGWAAAEELGAGRAAAEELGAGRASPRHALLATALLAKSLRQVDSPELIDEFSNWLVGEGHMSEWPLLLNLIDNCLTGDHDLTLETLRFFEVLIEKGTEHSLDRLVLARLASRGYCVAAAAADRAPPLQDERDRLNDLSFTRERERNREALQQLQHEQLVSSAVSALLPAPRPADLHHVINSLLLLLPRALLSDPAGAGCDHYVLDAQRHYQLWLDITSSYKWRVQADAAAEAAADTAASSTHSYDSRPEADMHTHTHAHTPDDTRHDLDNMDDNAIKKHSLVDPRDRRDTTNSCQRHPVETVNSDRTRAFYTTRRLSLAENNDSADGTDRVRRRSHADTHHRTINSRTEPPQPSGTSDTSDLSDPEGRQSESCPFTQTLVMRSRDAPGTPEEAFDEGPFLRMLLRLLDAMPEQPYQVNLHLTAILSKLALVPHPALHAYLLSVDVPTVPTMPTAPTLYTTLRGVARRLTAEVPRIKGFQKVIQSTRAQLMSEDPAYDEAGEHNQLVESLIVLEEFCKELAAIALVKHQHQLQLQIQNQHPADAQ